MPIGIDSTGIDSTVSSFRYNMVVHDNSQWFYCLCFCKFAKKYPKGYRGRRPRRGQDLVHTSLHVQHVLRGLSRQDRSWLFDNIPSSFKCHSLAAGTVGVDFSTALLDLPGGTRVRLQLWDIAGQERFTWMTRVYYREVMFRPNRSDWVRSDMQALNKRGQGTSPRYQ